MNCISFLDQDMRTNRYIVGTGYRTITTKDFDNWIFIFYSRISYFNPIFFLFGFNFYYIMNNKNIKVLLITRRQLKEPKNAVFNNLKRINNYTFIDMGQVL